ncbi:hypothetical protein E0Z10_g7499 [Xylaria hypoxylon]|uniref:Fungal N-terminal domain-containing protein n=1 Tax=Xylaria hypoxylon TaxID=37992 RepID=A0A4Z0YUX1_9PEZI|nr:hypothetical protein E0Z10_g7499 [Xylaria hypoxylon]
MAEALSVAASGIAVAQVAAQVGKSIIKLKQLWDDLKDVPSTIRDLLDQIECLDPALWEAETTFSQSSLPPMFWDNSLASRSTAYCRKALSSLTEIVDELALQINRPGKLRSKVASAKVVLKKELLKSLEHRLQNAVRMLTLAQQSYLVALTRIQPDIIIQRFNEITTPLITQTLQNNVQLERRGSFNTRHQQLPSKVMELTDYDEPQNRLLRSRRFPKSRDIVSGYRFRLPAWLSRTTWELQSSRSYGNWKLNLRCYSVVSEDSRVFEIARYGTPSDLQMLCARGLASPWDRDDFSHKTLLHSLNGPMVTYLLDIGLNPLEVNNYDLTPIGGILWDLCENSIPNRWPSINELEILFDFPGVSLDPKGKSNGYDLEEYGRRESELLADNDSELNRAVVCQMDKPAKRYRYDIAQLRGYEYGPEPKDWKILLSFPEKSYAADFWRLVEDGPQLVPGAWVEDSDDEEGYTTD